jgi:hypothetical protein
MTRPIRPDLVYDLRDVARGLHVATVAAAPDGAPVVLLSRHIPDERFAWMSDRDPWRVLLTSIVPRRRYRVVWGWQGEHGADVTLDLPSDPRCRSIRWRSSEWRS